MLMECSKTGDGKNSSQNELSGEDPSGENPSKVSCGENPSPYFGACGENPHPIFRLVEKTPQLYKKPSFWKFGIFIHLHIENHI